MSHPDNYSDALMRACGAHISDVDGGCGGHAATPTIHIQGLAKRRRR
jgi:hypothetical protein